MRQEVLFGGSFDPFHVGHAGILARLLLEDVDIVLMPAACSPFKLERKIPFSCYRFALILEVLRAEFSDDLVQLESPHLGQKRYFVDLKRLRERAKSSGTQRRYFGLLAHQIKARRLILSDEEILRRPPSYMVDTLRTRLGFRQERLGIKKTRQQDKSKKTLVDQVDPRPMALVGGDDLLDGFSRWKDVPGILRMAQLWILHRLDEEKEQEQIEEKAQQELEAKLMDWTLRYGASTRLLQAKIKACSSTHIRQELSTDESFVYGLDRRKLDSGKKKVLKALLHPAALDYIEAQGLYTQPDLATYLSAEQIERLGEYERILWPLMSMKRLVHSVNVMYTAIALAERFACDPWQVAQAALLHDLAKELDPKAYPDFFTALPQEARALMGLLHGPLGAHLASLWGLTDDAEVLSAITHHTNARVGASPLDLLVFFADKIEPGRSYADLEPLRDLARSDAKAAVKATFERILIHNRSRGYSLRPVQEMLDWLSE